MEELEAEEIFYKIGTYRHYPDQGRALPEQWSFEKNPIPYPIYEEGFREVMAEINYGNTFLINLAYPTPIQTDLTLRDIFRKSHARYKLLFRDQFLCFSPEIFVRIGGDTIRSYPMKGTIDAAIPNAKERILADEKETAEHYTIVDLIRNDLSIVATQVDVPRFRYVEKISTTTKDLLQVSSEVRGILPNNWEKNLGDILFKLLPAGSITGAPKKKTVEIIRSAEIEDRGYYTGIFGVFDGKNVDSAVMIRFIEEHTQGKKFRSGGGITFNSQARSEYNEMVDKVYLPFLRG